MDWQRLYRSPEWAHVRAGARRRDGNRCTVARLLGGDCSATLHVHHIVRDPELALELDNVATVCARHHPQWEAVRRAVLERRPVPVTTCGHQHRYDHARRACQRRLKTAA